MEKATLKAESDKVLQLLDDFESKDKLLILQEAMHKVGEEMNINPAKLSNGTMGESIVCNSLNLKWNADTIHGHDSEDTNGGKVEIKSATYRKNSKTRVNINYRLPARKRKNNTLEPVKQYAQRVAAKIRTDSGGHVWAARTGTEIVFTWNLDSEHLAEFFEYKTLLYLQKNPSKTEINFNFGTSPCKTCWRLHRIDKIAELVNSGQYEKACEPVAMNCLQK